LSILGLLVIVVLTSQMAIAAPRSARKSARAPASVALQSRDALGSASKATGSKSCDRFWCYENWPPTRGRPKARRPIRVAHRKLS